jgi:ABC-type nickel/cobalt efflux system permease component RcnA
MSFDFLYGPIEQLDGSLTSLFEGAGLLAALGIAFLLGLRHASDPDHLVAVTSLVASEDAGHRQAARLGAWWGAGHAATLLVIGLPLIALKSELPGWLETGAERAVGIVILLLAGRVLLKWFRGGYRSSVHDHPEREHRHLHRADRDHDHEQLRTPQQAFAIGVLHGLAGSGAVALLLITALPTELEAALALAVFAPVSAASMAACTAAFSWVLSRPAIEPVYRTVLIPALGAYGMLFGLWYAALA